MKLFLWVFGGLAVTGFVFWMMATPGIPGQTILVVLYAAICAVSTLGTLWMMYFSIRHERRPLPMILLAFVPYASLWYYFERVRPAKYDKRN